MVQTKLQVFIKAIVFGITVECSEALAAPIGGEVVAGDAVINSENSRNLRINQSSDKAIINWQNFNIANDEAVSFTTPSASSITLNRVIGNTPSDINGHLQSNGQLWLINRNGILFGQNAQVNVAGMVASTMNITSENFLNGNYTFAQDNNTAASIRNQGHLHAEDGGSIALLAPQIHNSGIIEAKLGTVAMGAGTQATLTFTGNQLLSIAVPEGAALSGNEAALTNSGTIAADGGRVLMTADSVNTLLDQSINVTGIIKADTVSQSEGKIILSANGNIIVDDATLSAQGKNASEHGGDIKIIGNNVALLNHTEVNVSGDSGGGDMRIGYDNRDKNGPEAKVTYIAPEVALKANAHHGAGGFIETSAHSLNVQTTQVSTNGDSSGTWLLDPWNITISNADTSGGDFSDGVFTPTNTSNINVAQLQTLLGTTNVTIATGDPGSDPGNITLNNDISWSSDFSLTLGAVAAIVLNANITNTGSGNLHLQAGTSISGAGNINLTHGAVSVLATDEIDTAHDTTLHSSQALQLGDIIISNGNLTITANGDITQSGVITLSGLISSPAPVPASAPERPTRLSSPIPLIILIVIIVTKWP